MQTILLRLLVGLLLTGQLTTTPAQAESPTSVGSQEIIPALPVEGDLVVARRWEDGQGVNFLLLTRTPNQRLNNPDYPDMAFYSARLYGYHYVQGAGGLQLKRRITDFVDDCELDMTVAHIPPSIRITDLDGDGHSEVTFLYELACRGDVSPLTLKLMMLEDGEKYPIRGTTIVDVGNGERYGGEKQFGEEFAKAPAAFRDFASQLWDRFVDTARR